MLAGKKSGYGAGGETTRRTLVGSRRCAKGIKWWRSEEQSIRQRKKKLMVLDFYGRLIAQ